jgi:tRNA threonylcarbamoyladenosine biosynthesis protein TsaB
MIVLALDTTTRAGSVALLRDDELLAVASGDPAKGHAERLPAALVRVLQERGMELPQVDVFGVAAGPGSFTGLRIGIATIQGLAFALGRPVAGVSVLDVLAVIAREAARDAAGPPDLPVQADGGGGPLVAAWMDAQRSEVFAALYPVEPGLVPVDGPVSETPAGVLERWQTLVGDQAVWFAGDGVARYYDLLVERLGSRFRAVEPLPPLAPTIARLAAAEAAAGRAVAPHAIRPVYVRRPDAELARDRKDAAGR